MKTYHILLTAVAWSLYIFPGFLLPSIALAPSGVLFHQLARRSSGTSIIDHKELVRNYDDTADSFIGETHTGTELDYGSNLYDGDDSIGGGRAWLQDNHVST